MNTLIELREQWEKKLSVVATYQDTDNTLLVVLKDYANDYHCHRYFTVGGQWNVSVDAAHLEDDTVIEYIMKEWMG